MKFFTSKAASPSEVASSSVAAPSFENVAHYHPFEEEEEVVVVVVVVLPVEHPMAPPPLEIVFQMMPKIDLILKNSKTPRKHAKFVP